MRRWTFLCLLTVLALAWPVGAQVDVNHPKTCTQPATASTSDVDCVDWNADHVFSGGSQGLVLYRDTGEANGANWTPSMLYDETTSSLKLFGGGVGASGVEVLSLGAGTAPTTSPADTVQAWVSDLNAEGGSAALRLRDERATVYTIGSTSSAATLQFTHSGGATFAASVASGGAGGSVGMTTSHDLALLSNNLTGIFLDTALNVGLGGVTTFGTNAAKVRAMTVGTAPTTSPTNLVQEWADDTDGAGTAGLFTRTESGHVHKVGRLAWRQAGSGTGFARTGGVLDSVFTNVGTDANTNEKDLYSFSVPGSTLGVNGQSLLLSGAITFGNNADNKTIRFKLGATTLFTQTLTDTTGASVLSFRLRIVRTGTAAQRADLTIDQNTLTGAVLASFATATETMANALDLKVTGQNEVATANDALFRHAKLFWEPE